MFDLLRAGSALSEQPPPTKTPVLEHPASGSSALPVFATHPIPAVSTLLQARNLRRAAPISRFDCLAQRTMPHVGFARSKRRD